MNDYAKRKSLPMTGVLPLVFHFREIRVPKISILREKHQKQVGRDANYDLRHHGESFF